MHDELLKLHNLQCGSQGSLKERACIYIYINYVCINYYIYEILTAWKGIAN